MSLNDIVKTIEEKVAQEIKSIEKNTDDAIADIKKETEQKIAEITKKQKSLADKKAEEKKRQAHQKAESAKKNAVLAKKQKILNEVFESAQKKLNTLDGVKKAHLFSKLVNELPQNIEGAKIITTEADEKTLKHCGATYPMEVKSDALPGFVFVSSSVEIDNTFKALVARVRDNVEMEVAKVLFE